jgi:hypothetical protein
MPKEVHIFVLTRRAAWLLAAFLTVALSLSNWGSPALAASGECGTPPAEAVTALPAPLSDWGTLACTPFGYVITAKEGWVWSRLGAYSPVFIPAQMVRSDPARLGSAAYFSKIELSKGQGAEFEAAQEAAFAGMDEPKIFTGYRLDVFSYSGRSLRLYFFEDGHSRWGIWCAQDKCDRASLFLIMDMSKRPA